MRSVRAVAGACSLLLGAMLVVVLTPQAVEARTQPNNSFEADARASCNDPNRVNRVFGTSWANNDGTIFGDTVTVNAPATTVTANFYSSAYLCNNSGTRNNIELINISDRSGRVTYSSTSIWRANSASPGTFAGPHSSQPMSITIDVSHITSSGTYSFPYRAVYRDSNGTGASADRSLLIRVNYQVPPTPPQTSASAACVSASGSINLDYEGSASVRFKAWLQGDPEPAGWQQERWYTNGYGESRSYSFTIPNTAKDAFRNTRVRIRHMYSPRSENNHDAFNGSVGLCGDSYDYRPSITNISNQDSVGNRKPGQTFVVSSQVANQGVNRSGTARRGPNYAYTLHIRSGASHITQTNPSQSLSYTRVGLFEGTTDTLPNRSFRINDNAPHGAQVCFEVVISPAAGQTWPTSGARTTVASRATGQQCFTIFNQQFELSNITISGDTDFVTPPPGGSSLNIQVRVVNNGNINNPPAAINNAGTVGGITNGVVTTLRVYSRRASETNWGAPVATRTSSTQIGRGATGVNTITYAHPIPQNTSEDMVYCFVAFANPVSGWSDGSSWGGAPFNDNPNPINTGNIDDCQNETRVTTQSYFQVHRNDIHSGVSFATESSPLRGCESINPAVGFIDAARTNSFGSLSEYAAYATGVIPTGTTRGFGSSATSTGSSLAASNFFTSSPMGTRLTFGNTPTLGNLGGDAYRCMSNLFELLEKSDVPQVSGTVTNFAGSLASPANQDAQVYAPSGLRLSTSGNNGLTSRRVTIIVNGDLFIDEDIRNYNTGGNYQNGNATFIVRGNINIHQRVRRVDALLYAIPDASGNGGALDTCYNHNLLGTDVCGNQLTINGIVVANRLDLKRTHGGISGGRTQAPAEVFRFSPVHFFRSPYFVFSEEAPRPDLPIQQMSDLPPRF